MNIFQFRFAEIKQFSFVFQITFQFEMFTLLKLMTLYAFEEFNCITSSFQLLHIVTAW